MDSRDVRIIKLFWNQKAKVRFEIEVKIKNGFRQDCVLSPLIYIVKQSLKKLF